MNALLQLFLPRWVRARGISIYLMVFFGGQALGAVLWGAIAAPAGLRPTFLAAAGLMLAGAATTPLWPLIDTRGMERDTAVYWPEPILVGDTDPGSGPVVVETRYTIATALEQQFLEAMANVRLSRLRTGATQWGLFRDTESEHVFVELFAVPSWEEHLRQHTERQTGVDHSYEEEADKLSDPPPQVSHLISTG
jgi:MFS family permease